MVHHRERLAFRVEPGEHFSGVHALENHFDRNRSLGRDLLCLEDDAHAALADKALDLVFTAQDRTWTDPGAKLVEKGTKPFEVGVEVGIRANRAGVPAEQFEQFRVIGETGVGRQGRVANEDRNHRVARRQRKFDLLADVVGRLAASLAEHVKPVRTDYDEHHLGRGHLHLKPFRKRLARRDAPVVVKNRPARQARGEAFVEQLHCIGTIGAAIGKKELAHESRSGRNHVDPTNHNKAEDNSIAPERLHNQCTPAQISPPASVARLDFLHDAISHIRECAHDSRRPDHLDALDFRFGTERHMGRASASRTCIAVDADRSRYVPSIALYPIVEWTWSHAPASHCGGIGHFLGFDRVTYGVAETHRREPRAIDLRRMSVA